MSKNTPIVAAADGSALGNPGPAGWAWYIDEDRWASGGWGHGTNNMGELKAVLDLFESTAHVPDRPLHIYCDSKYTIDSITKWMPGWKKKGWKKANGQPVLNIELMVALDTALTGRTYTFEWVKGHAGHRMNERADTLAKEAAAAYRDGLLPPSGPGFGGSVAAPVPSGTAARETGSQSAEPGPEQLVAQREDLLTRTENFSDAKKLASLLSDSFVWVTSRGVSVDKNTVIEHRQRAFLLRSVPEVLATEMLGDSSALVLSRVDTPHGEVIRTSIWVRENSRAGAWLLRFRQETAC